MKKCDICNDDHSENTLSCEYCHKVVSKYQNKTKYAMDEVRKALRDAYLHKYENVSYFKCKYTNMIGTFHNQNEDFQNLTLNLDHKNPNSDELVVSLNIINKMKTDIPYDDFINLVITLGEYFRKKNDSNFKKLEDILKTLKDA